MTGFANVEEGVKHFFQHIAGVVDTDVEAALKLLNPLVTAVTSAIKTNGLPAIEGALATIAGAIIPGGATLASVEVTTVTALSGAAETVGKDALKALEATASVSASQGAQAA
jgi:hypothetical protein